MVLNNVWLVNGTVPVNVKITGNKITNVDDPNPHDDLLQLTFDNANIFPGLINSHDHLDFNLFPQLGDQLYKNYTEWGKHLHKTYKTEINKVLNVPILLREEWGILKNMVCGVTTVVNHGEKIKTSDPLITVHENYYCLHSVGFEKRWKVKLNNPFQQKYPVVIHTGEGTNTEARYEIDQLITWNRLHKKLIGIHGVAMIDKQAEKFEALVWCPQSNYFLLGYTAPIDHLKKHTNILFGTDSTLTGDWDIWDHIAMARKTGLLTDEELYNSLHENASVTWKINNSKIANGATADLIVTSKKDGQNGLAAFFVTEPKDILLVVHQGEIRLFDAFLIRQLTHIDLSQYSMITVNGAKKYVVGNVPGLMNNIKEYYPGVTFPFSAN